MTYKHQEVIVMRNIGKSIMVLAVGVLMGLASTHVLPAGLGGPASLRGWYAATDATPSVLVVDDLNGKHVELLVEARVRNIDVVVVPSGGWSAAQAVRRMREVGD